MRSRRRLLKAALATFAPGLSLASQPLIEVNTPLFRQLHAQWGQAVELFRKGSVLQAAAVLGRAYAVIEESPSTRWPWRVRFGPAYGHVLLTLGNNEKALEVLEQSFAAETRILADRLMPFFKVLEHRDASWGLELFTVELTRQVVSVVAVSDHDPHALGELVFDTSIASAEVLFTFGRAQLACGQCEALGRLYLQRVADAALAPTEDMGVRRAREDRAFKFGVLLALAGRPQLADQAMQQALRMNFKRLQESAEYFSGYGAQLAAIGIGRQMLSVWTGRLMNGQENGQLPAARTQELMGLILQFKGLGARYSEHLHRLLVASTRPVTIAAKQQLEELENRMADLPVSRDGVLGLMELAEQCGVHLARALPELRERGLGQVIVAGDVLLPRVRRALDGDGAIGFMVYQQLDDTGVTTASSRYLRYCIAGETIELKDAGECEAVNRLVFAFRRALLEGGDGRSHGALLVSHLLTELPEAVERAHRWVIDPDGALALLPFEALPDESGAPLLLRRTLRYVTSLAQLIPGVNAVPAVGPVCVVANPAYPAQSRREDQSLAEHLSPRAWNGSAVTSLPETVLEASAVDSAMARMGWPVERLEGKQATAQALLDLQQPPRVLHVASHAIIFNTSVDKEAASLGRNGPGDNIVDLMLPGRRAALVLAGEIDPSLLLALDFSRVPLQGTSLAVLSACDTGNGDVDVGEGVSSLRRALEQSGVASTVTSLWPVPSRGTVMLMAGFYRRLEQGLPKSRALQLAKLEHRERGAPMIEWASFLLAGADSPLTGASSVAAP